MNSAKLGERDNRAWRIAAISALLVAVAIVVAATIAEWSAWSSDRSRMAQDGAALSILVTDHQDLVADAANHIAGNIGTTLSSSRNVDWSDVARLLWPTGGSQMRHQYAYLLDAAGTVLMSYPSLPSAVQPPLAPSIAALVTQITPVDAAGRVNSTWSASKPGNANTNGTTSLAMVDGMAYFVAVAPVLTISAHVGGQPFNPARLVLMQALDIRFLSRIAVTQDLVDLRFDDGPPSTERGSVVLKNADGGTLGWLSWLPEHRMTAAFIRTAPIAAGLTLFLLFLAILAYQQAMVARRRSAEREAYTRYAAEHDTLTSLLNRGAFRASLDRYLEKAGSNEPVGLVHIDLDGFKGINESFGYQAGDELLKVIADRIRGAVGENAIIGRLGSDEFAAILTNTLPDAAAREGAALSKAIRMPMIIQGANISMQVTIGIACAPDHGSDSEELLRHTTTALVAAKRRGAAKVVIFEPAMEETNRARKLVEQDMRAALLSGEIYLAYQPIFAGDGTRPLGAEALLRWKHPTLGMVSPADFIPIAEETSFIRRLGAWVLEQACRDALEWGNLAVAVNLSPVQVGAPDLVESVARILNETGLHPSRLVLEITEGVLIEQQDEALVVIQALQKLGVRLALDDFGTGYSSLAYLRRFPVDKLKIDKSFVDSLGQSADDATIVHSIISLGRALGMSVVAEGVETKEQHRFLRAAGCHEMQGYLFSKPVAAAQIQQLAGVLPRQVA